MRDSHIPILICAYSRLEEFKNTLKLALDTGCQPIYVNLDGSSDPNIKQIQDQIQSHVIEISEINQKKKILFRRANRNFGSAVSVISGIDWFFTNEEFGIIVEDDLIFSSDLVDFAVWALDVYATHPDVWIISGSNFFSEIKNSQNLMQCANYPITWGWATWAKKWQDIRFAIIESQGLPSGRIPHKVNTFWKTGAKRSRSGILDAWDIPLANYMRRKNKVTLIPPVNLVSNIGFGDDATHTSKLGFPLNLPLEKLSAGFYAEQCVLESSFNTTDYNRYLEKYVYKISFKHNFSYLISFFDSFRFNFKFDVSLQQRISETKFTDFHYHL